MNWDLGHYEHLAAQLRPAAVDLVDQLAPGFDEVVLDLGCGTGNAAIHVAGTGARVIGVDPSPRLLDIARTAAVDQGLPAVFTLGEAGALPVADGSVDAIVSAFGVIFASDAKAAVAEMVRVLRPGGRIVFSAWLRQGALADQARLRRELLDEVQPERAPGELFAWHDLETLEMVFAPYGYSVAVQERSLLFTGTSPEGFAAAELADHPRWVEARATLDSYGRGQRVHADLTKLYVAANEVPAGFGFTGRYVIATARRRCETGT